MGTGMAVLLTIKKIIKVLDFNIFNHTKLHFIASQKYSLEAA